MPTYSDSEMRAIMGRALQIDSGRSERFTPEQLRTIAAELGISTQALEVAMYEADSNNRVMPHSTGSGSQRWTKGLLLAVGVLLVFATSFVFLRNERRGDADRAVFVRSEARAVPVEEMRAPPVTKKTAPAKITTKQRF